MKSKIFISLTGLLLVLCAIVVYIIDPYFHFHKPISNLAYVFSDERYINDGIGRHFDYNAVITGTSMTENFKTSEFDELFSKNSIKVPYSGGSYYEISLALQRMLSRNSDVELVLWGLDYNRLDNEWNNLRYSSYPDYLYDDKIWNDIKYLLNKDSVVQAVRTLAKTVLGGEATTMDEYASWSFPTGKEAVLKSYERIDKVPKSENILLTDEEKNVTIENIDKNIVEVVEANPQIKFMFFITPYSIVYWDSCNQNNQVSKQIERERLLIEALVDYPNVEIYCFFNHEDLICDLDNYKDIAHYSADVNSQILNWIAEGKYQVTRADMEQHLEETKEFYENYNYDMIFEEN